MAFLATTCDAGEATFSKDGQTIYIPTIESNDYITMREIDLRHQVSRRFPLTEVQAGNHVCDVAATCDNQILCCLPDSLWSYDPTTHTMSKNRNAPDGSPFGFVAYDPKTHANFVTTGGEDALLRFARPEAEPVSIFVRRHHRVDGPVFTADGEMLYCYAGDLWLGKVHEDPLGRGPCLAAFRVAPLATLETDDTTPGESGVHDIAVSRDFIYTHLYRMGGSGWGWLVRLGRSHMKYDLDHELDVVVRPDERFSIYRQALNSVRILGSNDHLSFLCNSPDETSTYYCKHGEDWLIRNGRMTRLHLREESP